MESLALGRYAQVCEAQIRGENSSLTIKELCMSELAYHVNNVHLGILPSCTAVSITDRVTVKTVRNTYLSSFVDPSPNKPTLTGLNNEFT